MIERKLIGILGGVGPYAGLDLNKKIFDSTISKIDQDHLNVVLFSLSKELIDRTDYLTGKRKNNIAESVVKIILMMKKIGIIVVGIPCNTIFAGKIYEDMQQKIIKKNIAVDIVNMIDEVGIFIKKYFISKKIGILGTNGTVLSKVYTERLKKYDLKTIYPEPKVQEVLHNSIYNEDYGIKSESSPVSEKARKEILDSIDHLINKGSELVVLGCTELPLAISEKLVKDVPIVDSTLILARALVKRVSPEKLKQININEYYGNSIRVRLKNN